MVPRNNNSIHVVSCKICVCPSPHWWEDATLRLLFSGVQVRVFQTSTISILRHSFTHLPEGNRVRTFVGDVFIFFWTSLFVRAIFFLENAQLVDPASPPGHIGQNLGALRALLSARQTLKSFFDGSGQYDLSRLNERVYQVPECCFSNYL